MNAQTIGGLSVAIALAVVAWFLGGRNKSVADTAKTTIETAGQMVEQLRQELQRLTLKVDNLERENQRLREQVTELMAHIRRIEGDHGA